MEFIGEEKGADERRQVCGFRVWFWTYLRFRNVDRDRGEVFKAREEKPRDRGRRRRRRRRRSQRATRHEDVIKRLQRTSPLANFPNPIYAQAQNAYVHQQTDPPVPSTVLTPSPDPPTPCLSHHPQCDSSNPAAPCKSASAAHMPPSSHSTAARSQSAGPRASPAWADMHSLVRGMSR